MLDWSAAVAFGAIGGAVVEGIALWGRLSAWQSARREARVAGIGSLPQASMFIDPVPDLLVALTRITLGALAGLVFHGEVTGVMAAMAVGASAPALLTQLGSATRLGSIQQGDVPGSAPASERV